MPRHSQPDCGTPGSTLPGASRARCYTVYESYDGAPSLHEGDNAATVCLHGGEWILSAPRHVAREVVRGTGAPLPERTGGRLVKRTAALTLASLLLTGSLYAQSESQHPTKKDGKKDDAKKAETKKEPFSSGTFAGLKLRAIGPALTSGRVADLAVDSKNPSIYYVASASGGVWKTVNHGTTFQPVFDSEHSYSIGAVTIDPNDSLVVWVGSGENNSQRSVSYGDGLYKSVDGGQTWENVGLKTSEHIAKILVDPRNSDTVYVASQGPLWSSGGERGL